MSSSNRKVSRFILQWISERPFANISKWSAPGGVGVLPYKGLMGTCGQPGYVFRDFCLKQGVEFIIFCLNQGIDLSIFVLNRMSFLRLISCFPLHLFRALPLPACFTTEHSTLEASLFANFDAIIGNQAFQNERCHICFSLGLDKVKPGHNLLME